MSARRVRYSCGREDCCSKLTELRTLLQRCRGVPIREGFPREDFEIIEVRTCRRGHYMRRPVHTFSRRRDLVHAAGGGFS